MTKQNGNTASRHVLVLGCFSIWLSVVASGCCMLNVSAAQAHGTSSEVLRPHTWFGQPLRARPSPTEIRRHDRMLEAMRQTFRIGVSVHAPVTDPAVLGLLAEAQVLVAQRRHVRGAWHWAEVREIIAGIGTRYPVVYPSGRTAERRAIMAWDSYNHMLYLYPDASLTGNNPAAFAELLVHEATHEVVSRRFLERSGFAPRELFRTQIACHDVSTMLYFVTEVLAFTNQAAWAASSPGGPSFFGPTSRTVALAAAARRNDGDARRRFAMVMAGYAIQEARSLRYEVWDDPRFRRSIFCGPVPVLHGARRGEYFLPSDIAPSLTVPLLRTLE